MMQLRFHIRSHTSAPYERMKFDESDTIIPLPNDYIDKDGQQGFVDYRRFKYGAGGLEGLDIYLTEAH